MVHVVAAANHEEPGMVGLAEVGIDEGGIAGKNTAEGTAGRVAVDMEAQMGRVVSVEGDHMAVPTCMQSLVVVLAAVQVAESQFEEVKVRGAHCFQDVVELEVLKQKFHS
jgi:hypothetical protein